jgi:hypothetical protein
MLNHESPVVDYPDGRPTGGGNVLRRMGTIWMSVFRKTCTTLSVRARVWNVERPETTVFNLLAPEFYI